MHTRLPILPVFLPSEHKHAHEMKKNKKKRKKIIFISLNRFSREIYLKYVMK